MLLSIDSGDVASLSAKLHSDWRNIKWRDVISHQKGI